MIRCYEVDTFGGEQGSNFTFTNYIILKNKVRINISHRIYREIETTDLVSYHMENGVPILDRIFKDVSFAVGCAPLRDKKIKYSTFELI